MPRPRKGARVRGPYEDKSRARWRLDVIGGNGRIRPLFFGSERRALDKKEEIEGIIESRANTTAQAIDEYLTFLRQKGNRESSLARTEWALREFFPKPIKFIALTDKRCKGLYDDLRTRPKRVQVGGEWVRPATGDPLSNDSHRAALKEAKSFLRWCVEQGFLAANPAEGIKGIGKLRPRGKSLGKAGVKLKTRQAREWYAKALEMAEAGDTGAIAAVTAVLLGMRASEIAHRRVGDLDTDERPGDVLHVPGVERKNGEDLALEVPDPLRELLLSLAEGKAESRFLFESRAPTETIPNGAPRSRWWIRSQIHRVCDAASVPRMTAHACRGLLANVALERGMAAHLVAATLGHDEKVMRGHYAEPGAAEAAARKRGLTVLEGGRKESTG